MERPQFRRLVGRGLGEHRDNNKLRQVFQFSSHPLACCSCGSEIIIIVYSSAAVVSLILAEKKLGRAHTVFDCFSYSRVIFCLFGCNIISRFRRPLGKSPWFARPSSFKYVIHLVDIHVSFEVYRIRRAIDVYDFKYKH